MCMQVDEARRDHMPLGVDLFLALGRDLANLGDAAVLDAHVAVERSRAGAVDDLAAANDCVVTHETLPVSKISVSRRARAGPCSSAHSPALPDPSHKARAVPAAPRTARRSH